ncbi:MAG: flagellar basal body-associated FliL family protein [Gemmatimonadetes bacterium]|nr:flagellar basal body-associated FliL family protein [Gemmatimonadota bacterium]
MADQTTDPNVADSPSPEEESPKKSMSPIVLFPMVGVLYGVILLVGWFVTSAFVGPAIADHLVGKEREKVFREILDDGKSGPNEVLMIDDLVVNPAGSQGMRYVATSIGVEIKAESLPAFEARIPKIQDCLIRILGSKTVDELSDVNARETLREEIKEELGFLVRGHEIISIYFVSFVLQ